MTAASALSPTSTEHFRRWLAPSRWPPARILLWLGLAALIVPTLINLGRWSWSGESGAHAPIVLATGAWLLWRDRHLLARAAPAPSLPVALLLVLLLPLYAAGRITGVLMVESLSLYLILLTIAYLRLGNAVLRGFWFPAIYALFLITPPENWMFVATRPIKMALSDVAVSLLSQAGLAVGSTGTMIQIDGYQLLVATACSGINSLIGITAISLFYVFLRRGNEPRYALLLALLLVPIGILTNFIRIILLILVTHWFGESLAQSLAHDLAGIVMFGLAILLLLAIDALLYPLLRRRRHAR